jgi:outer membrane protein OmpA-like peptidoglycan-associated protein
MKRLLISGLCLALLMLVGVGCLHRHHPAVTPSTPTASSSPVAPKGMTGYTNPVSQASFVALSQKVDLLDTKVTSEVTSLKTGLVTIKDVAQRNLDRIEKNSKKLSRITSKIVMLQDKAEAIVPGVEIFYVGPFGNGQYKLTPAMELQVSKIAKYIITEKLQVIMIVGSASKDGPADLNKYLSGKRAGSVRNLLKNAGVDISVAGVEGLGETSKYGDPSQNRIVYLVAQPKP